MPPVINNTNPSPQLYALLREARWRAGLSRRAVCAAVGVSTRRLIAMEHGDKPWEPEMVKKFYALVPWAEGLVKDWIKHGDTGADVQTGMKP